MEELRCGWAAPLKLTSVGAAGLFLWYAWRGGGGAGRGPLREPGRGSSSAAEGSRLAGWYMA